MSGNGTDLVGRGPVIGMLRPPGRPVAVVVVVVVMVVMVVVLIVVVRHQLHPVLGLCGTKAREVSIRARRPAKDTQGIMTAPRGLPLLPTQKSAS